MTVICYVCSSPELATDADRRNPTCEACKPAREHVVSMQTGDGGSSLAVCRCGWRFEAWSEDRRALSDGAVYEHWVAVIAAAPQGAVD